MPHVNWKHELASPRFWMVVAGALLTIANQGLGLGLNGAAVTKVVGLIVALVLTSGYVEGKHVQAAAAALKANPPPAA